jgi:hypothetical protein
MLTKYNLNQSPHVLEGGASGCANGDIEQVIDKMLLRI